MNKLQLSLSRESAALERVMRLVRHRGFALLEARLSQGDDRQLLCLHLAGERPLNLLTAQLSRLPDVLSLNEEEER
ncbi:ACT domain-containing protein [Gallaecimonas sp. GXIMD4217]|uniref:ACT domain-containing protein n=1 Tax=Gallaecimonas sp. GXIMD4217 TaxID=3131927 RepID=UPI00311B17F1